MFEAEWERILEFLRGRVDDLPRQNRLRRLFEAAFLIGRAAPGRKTLEADLVIVKDRNGNKRFELDGGVPQFVLHDEQGVPRARLDLPSDEPCLKLSDRSETRKILLGGVTAGKE